MMMEPTMDETGRVFLAQLYEQTKGDVSAQVSMYDVGESIGMDRTTASRTAEDLIGMALVEIRTLSGSIGITDAGVSEIDGQNAGTAGRTGKGPTLGSDPVLDGTVIEAVSQLMTALKNDTTQMGLDFDRLNEFIADIKTIETQLTSTRPKTAIIRECFHSLKGVLDTTDSADNAARVNTILED